MIEWVKAGRIKADFPAHAKDKDDWQPLLVIELDGTTSFYERTPYPIRNENRCVAYGSGKEYAVAAMHLGKTAREAIEVAIALDCGSGNGIDTLRLDESTDEQWPSPAGGFLPSAFDQVGDMRRTAPQPWPNSDAYNQNWRGSAEPPPL